MYNKVLIIEDEDDLLSGLKLNFELENYLVETAESGAEGLEKILNNSFDLIILDVMLPEMDGFTVCEKAREKGVITPIIFLTAKSNNLDKINGLKLGADDYLTKPFSLEELMLRAKIILKRSVKTIANDLNNFEFEGNRINFSTYEVINYRGEIDSLSKKEVELLRLLISKKNEVVSRDEILDAIWADHALPTPRTIDNFILTFRKLFEKNAKEPQHFHSIRGVGYKFVC